MLTDILSCNDKERGGGGSVYWPASKLNQLLFWSKSHLSTKFHWNQFVTWWWKHETQSRLNDQCWLVCSWSVTLSASEKTIENARRPLAQALQERNVYSRRLFHALATPQGTSSHVQLEGRSLELPYLCQGWTHTSAKRVEQCVTLWAGRNVVWLLFRFLRRMYLWYLVWGNVRLARHVSAVHSAQGTTAELDLLAYTVTMHLLCTSEQINKNNTICA